MSKKRYAVTGCAGFIGSNLTDRLLSEGHEVVGIDNLTTGREAFLEYACSSDKFDFKNIDILNTDELTVALNGCNTVFHLAANADVKDGLKQPGKDINQNTLGTFSVLEAMRGNGIKEIGFASTGSVYGEAQKIPTPEDCAFPIQTSLYAASKLAGEALVSAYCEGYGFKGVTFRFVGILGERYTHGHIFDFMKKLHRNNAVLHVLGNGTQKKSYLYVQDCIDAMLLAMNASIKNYEVFNLGTDEFCEVTDSIQVICSELGVNPELILGTEDRGWVGDNPFIYLDTKKIRSLGWEPKLKIREGVKRTIRYLAKNRWVF